MRRPIADWEHVLARCWDTLPAQDSLLAHAPDMVWRVLAARLFPEAPGSDANWERTSDESVTALTGWRFLRGSFDDDFPRGQVMHDGGWGLGTGECWSSSFSLSRQPKRLNSNGFQLSHDISSTRMLVFV